MPSMRQKYRFLFLLLLLLSVVVILGIGELLARVVDGYRLLPLYLEELPRRKYSKMSKTYKIDDLKFPLTFAKLTEEEARFFHDMQKILFSNKNPHFFVQDFYKLWNSDFVREADNKWKYFYNWPIPLETFDGGGSKYPKFVYKKNRDIFYSKEHKRHINSWGWVSKKCRLPKPSNIFRIVCIGASTTEDGNPRSYPESLELFLNEKLKDVLEKTGRQIEVLNGGFHFYNIKDIAWVFKNQVINSEADMVIFYEGANNFDNRGCFGCDDKCLRAMPRIEWIRWNAMGRRSALYRKVAQLLNPRGRFLAEAPKPLHFFDANIKKCGITDTIEVLNEMIELAIRKNIKFIMTSFIAMVYDGLIIDVDFQPSLWNDLNRGYWPLTYKEIETLYAVQNKEYRKLANKHNIPFLDVAAYYPKEPKYFTDSIHFTQKGSELLAETIANLLVPHLQKIIGK